MGVITINLLDFKFLETRGYHSSFHLWEDREKRNIRTSNRCSPEDRRTQKIG